MGRQSVPSVVSTSSMPRLSSQHERLILELLPFKDSQQFNDWLDGVYVRGSWREFCADFLEQNPMAPEPPKDKIAQAAKDAINSKNPKFLAHHPDKDAWISEDHHVRFIVTVISDNMLKGLWSESEWKKRSMEIAKSVYEVLSYLRATSQPSPPSYSD